MPDWLVVALTTLLIPGLVIGTLFFTYVMGWKSNGDDGGGGDFGFFDGADGGDGGD